MNDPCLNPKNRGWEDADRPPPKPLREDFQFFNHESSDGGAVDPRPRPDKKKKEPRKFEPATLKVVDTASAPTAACRYMTPLSPNVRAVMCQCLAPTMQRRP